MRTIRAAVCREFGAPLSIEEVQLRAPGPNEAEIEIEAVAICHSDISYASGAWGGPLPAVYGHEAAGRITKLGGPAPGLAEGMRVAVTLIRACGHCPDCSTGHPVICSAPPAESPLSMPGGGALTAAMNCGAFASHVVADISQLAPVPQDMPAETVSLLACGVITGVGAVVNTARLRAGEDVVVIGAGGVGLNAIQGARLAGARRITAVDLSPSKLEDALAFGATGTVDASQPKPWRAARELNGRGADAVIVCTGALPAYDDAPRYLAPGGRMVMVGMPHVGGQSAYEPVIFAAAGQGMLGSKMGDAVIKRDIPWMADLYAQGRLQLDELISRRWSLDEINEAIADTAAGNARRNVIVMG